MAENERRSFLRKLSLSVAASGLGIEVLAGQRNSLVLARPGAEPQARISANDRIRIGLIGSGIRGPYNVRTALSLPGVEIGGVADVYQGRLVRAKEWWGKDLYTTQAYEELIARPDIDAIFIAGTHHWNWKMSVEALKAGKAVYCEKPMVRMLEEGPKVIAAEKKAGKVFMVGSQRVSSIIYEKARQLYREGAIGELNYVEAWWDRFSHTGAWQYSIAPDASEKNIDWKRFIGDAPALPFEPKRLFRWRNYRDYSTGIAGDLFVHLFSGLHFILDSTGPNRLISSGGLRYWKDGRDIPDVLLGLVDYPKTASHPAFNLVLRTNFVDGSGGSSGFRFVGSEGLMTVNDQGITLKKAKLGTPGYTIDSFPQALQEQYLAEWKAQYGNQRPQMGEPKELEYKTPDKYSDMVDHLSVFFEAMRSGKKVVEDATFGFRAAAPAIMVHEAYYDGKIRQWDPEKMLLKTS